MTAWVVQALLGSALLMALILAIRSVNFVNLAGARALYALWALPALRLALPPLPTPVSTGPLAVSFEVIAGTASGGSAGAGAQLLSSPWLWSLWLGGAALFAGWQAIAYRRFVRRALRSAWPIGEVDGIAVLATPAVAGPVAIGPWRPRILVPAAFMAQPAAERDLALAHEALHHKRGDLWANLLACAVLALHWFNPLAHLAHRAFRRDQELACDAAVIGGADADSLHHYGRALARAAGALPPAPATTLGETSTLKRRLDMLKAHRARTTAAGRIAVGALGIAALALTATSGVTAAPPEIKKVETIVITKKAGEQSGDSEVSKLLAERCAGNAARKESQTQVVENGETKTRRVIVCQSDGSTGELGLAQLESARASLTNSQKIKPEHRAKVLSALDAAIADLKAKQ